MMEADVKYGVYQIIGSNDNKKTLDIAVENKKGA